MNSPDEITLRLWPACETATREHVFCQGVSIRERDGDLTVHILEARSFAAESSPRQLLSALGSVAVIFVSRFCEAPRHPARFEYLKTIAETSACAQVAPIVTGSVNENGHVSLAMARLVTVDGPSKLVPVVRLPNGGRPLAALHIAQLPSRLSHNPGPAFYLQASHELQIVRRGQQTTRRG